MRQDNLPDYGIPGAAWSEDAAGARHVQPAQPVDQANYYGSPAFDYDRAEQTSVLSRVEHDLAPGRLVANQTRYNRTHREAVVSAIQNVAAYVAGDGARHDRAAGQRTRERDPLEPDDVRGPLLDRPAAPRLQRRRRGDSREPVCADSQGLGTRAP